MNSLGADGAEHLPGAARVALDALEPIIEPVPRKAGVRFCKNYRLQEVLGPGSEIGNIAIQRLGSNATAVRAVLFNKSPENNWSLGWHQDRTIAVTSRAEIPGFGPFTTKSGILHVAPPIDVVSRMITLRIHLDDVDENNAPLLVAKGSHRLGWIGTAQVAGVVERSEIISCVARRGDVWIYSTPILHASMRAVTPRARRVLQVDYSADKLPTGLSWLGL